MLEKPSDELNDIDGYFSGAVAAGLTIGKGDVSFFDGDNATVGNGYPKDVRRKILERSFGIADRLAVDIPRHLPGFGINERQQTVFLHLCFEFGLEDFREGSDRQIEIIACGKPLFPVL